MEKSVYMGGIPRMGELAYLERDAHWDYERAHLPHAARDDESEILARIDNARDHEESHKADTFEDRKRRFAENARRHGL